jgi:hypothetical protein
LLEEGDLHLAERGLKPDLLLGDAVFFADDLLRRLAELAVSGIVLVQGLWPRLRTLVADCLRQKYAAAKCQRRLEQEEK